MSSASSPRTARPAEPRGQSPVPRPDPAADPALEAVFQADRVTPASLRTLYEQLTSYVESLRESLRIDATDAAYARCIAAIEDLRVGRVDAEDAIDRITELIGAMTSRVDRLEATVQPPQGDRDSIANAGEEPEGATPPNEDQVEVLQDLADEIVRLADRVRRVPAAAFNAKSPHPYHAPGRSRSRSRSLSPLLNPTPTLPTPPPPPPDYKPGGPAQDLDATDPLNQRATRAYEDPRDTRPPLVPAHTEVGRHEPYLPPFPPLETSNRAAGTGYVVPPPIPTSTSALFGYYPRTDKSPRPPPYHRDAYPLNPLHPLGSHGYPADRALQATLSWARSYPGLPDGETLLETFRAAVSYRAYRLRLDAETVSEYERGHLSRIVRHVTSLRPTLEPFTGKEPIKLLAFLREIVSGFDTENVSEGVAMLAVRHFLADDALRFYNKFVAAGVRALSISLPPVWPVLVHQLLRRYCTDKVLGDAYDRVTRMTQDKGEDELRFADRIEDAALDCPGVFTEPALVNYFIRGLPDTTREAVSAQAARLPLENRQDFFVIRQVAHAEGSTYRARLRELKPHAAPRPKATSKPTLLLGEGPADPIEYPSPPRSASDSHLGPEDFENLFSRGVLDSSNEVPYPVLVTGGEIRTSSAASDTLTEIDITARVERELPRPLPTLDQEQTRCANVMIPENDSWYVCWACRDVGQALPL